MIVFDILSNSTIIFNFVRLSLIITNEMNEFMQTQTRPDDLNRRLRRLRLAAGMSQSDVGKNIGLPRSAVTQIELGNRDLSADELVRFATAFQRSPTALLTPSNEFDNDQNSEDDEVLIEFQDAVKSSGESLEL